MLFKYLGQGRINAYSAGSKPGGQVNPVALETLARHGVPCDGARSKSWDEFKADAVMPSPTLDFIFTVCDNAAREVCPIWPGHPATMHWGISDPAHVEPIDARREAFEDSYQTLKQHIEAFLALPLESMSAHEAIDAARRIHTGA